MPAAEGAIDAVAFPMPADLSSGFVAPLTHLGVISAHGADAAHFLHNQLTNDVQGLDGAHARLAGYCSPKGRLLATLLVWKDGDRVLLALPRSLLPATLKRLQMFVLRAKVTLQDVSEQVALIGVASATAFSGAMPGARLGCVAAHDGTLIRMPDAAVLQRMVWVGPSAQAANAWQQYASSVPPAPAACWRWSEIMAGVAQVVDATREQFVPQMINYELVGGVNFQKGCYPGQEIVARSQYLGKQKRRTLLAFSDNDGVTAGSEVFSAADPTQPCGMIVNAERGPDGRTACLVEVKLEAASTAVSVGAVDGPSLTFGELPYALPASE